MDGQNIHPHALSVGPTTMDRSQYLIPDFVRPEFGLRGSWVAATPRCSDPRCVGMIPTPPPALKMMHQRAQSSPDSGDGTSCAEVLHLYSWNVWCCIGVFVKR